MGVPPPKKKKHYFSEQTQFCVGAQHKCKQLSNFKIMVDDVPGMHMNLVKYAVLICHTKLNFGVFFRSPCTLHEFSKLNVCFQMSCLHNIHG